MAPIDYYRQFLENKISLDECVTNLRRLKAFIMADAILITEENN